MPRFTKEDVEFHSDGGPSRPAVNVKVYDSLMDGYRAFCKSEPDADTRFTLEWIEEHVSDGAGCALFGYACERGYEMLTDYAREIWGNGKYTSERRGNARSYIVNVYAEGRSNGWAIVDGIDDDVDGWDAIALGRWARFSRMAKAEASDIMYQVVWSIYYNAFEEWSEEETERLGAEAFAPENLPVTG